MQDTSLVQHIQRGRRRIYVGWKESQSLLVIQREKQDVLLTGNVQPGHRPIPMPLISKRLLQNSFVFLFLTTTTPIHPEFRLAAEEEKKTSAYLDHSSLLRFQVDNTIFGPTVLCDERSYTPCVCLGGVLARWWGREIVVRKTHLVMLVLSRTRC